MNNENILIFDINIDTTSKGCIDNGIWPIQLSRGVVSCIWHKNHEIGPIYKNHGSVESIPPMKFKNMFSEKRSELYLGKVSGTSVKPLLFNHFVFVYILKSESVS